MDRKPNSDSSDQKLSSTEYRARLLTKLNCLIAVLEVAIAKISRSMDVPGANEERLTKIRSNLENTLSICNRAKNTLESSSATKQLPGPTVSRDSGKRPMSYRDYVELSSIDEYKKFKALPPIKAEEIHDTDIDALIGQFFTD